MMTGAERPERLGGKMGKASAGLGSESVATRVSHSRISARSMAAASRGKGPSM